MEPETIKQSSKRDTWLFHSRKQRSINHFIQDEEALIGEAPESKNNAPMGCGLIKVCWYHKTKDHKTNDCKILKRDIEDLF